ncbi:hypothetical protein TNCV_2824351 [Trichonephila clavipes]|nr:hypothetical protein TNCV_2824351 [Trichonephila clavipes]
MLAAAHMLHLYFGNWDTSASMTLRQKHQVLDMLMHLKTLLLDGPVKSEPAPVNRLVISSAVSNTGSFGIPKTVALGLVLQLGGALGELADHIPNLYYYTPVPPLR